VTAFADSSVLVKRYLEEPGSSDVLGRGLLVVAALARVEVVSAFWRRARNRELTADEAGLLAADFETDWQDPSGPYALTDITAAVLEQGARAVRVHGLRAYDAVQLACAMTARGAAPEVDTFLCADRDLADAARREGFATS
jgi:predicted nucleic acid-binding protein